MSLAVNAREQSFLRQHKRIYGLFILSELDRIRQRLAQVELAPQVPGLAAPHSANMSYRYCLILERAGVEETKSVGVTVEVSEQESEDQAPDKIPANATDQDVPHAPGETELAREDAVKSDTVGDVFLERVEKLASDTLALQAQQAPTLKSGQVCCVRASPERK